MGAKANGKLKSPTAAFPYEQSEKHAAMNAPKNASLHQSPSSRSGHVTRANKRRGKQSWLAWTGNKGAKLVVWYILITVLLRCPSHLKDVNDANPKVCKPYLHTRDFLVPYARPYYDHYLAPYVQHVQPYYTQVNERLYKPGYAAYEKYGAPRVAQAQRAGEQTWQTAIKPQLDRVQGEAGKQYEKTFAPHVRKVQGVVQPYYNGLSTSASDMWELQLEPLYRKSAPYVHTVYQHGQAFTVNTALPHARYAGGKVWAFWTRQIWPKMRILYGENVEPQLMRITERLGRFKDGKKLEADIKSMESSSKSDKASASIEAVASSISASVINEVTASPSSTATASYSTPEPSADPAAAFDQDLKSWEHISAKAVEEGAEDLKERVDEITAQRISNAHNVGSALVTQLEQTSEAALNSVMSRILQLVRDLPEDADDDHVEAVKDDLTQAIRAAGNNVKSRAQAVRAWRRTSESETESLVDKALQSTLETIDSIRELRLTEIGRKYASSSLPHKEWSKYNAIKKSTQSWRDQVEKTAHGHKGLTDARNAAVVVEETAMAVAEDAAKELSRLKKVGQWKIMANDESDDFATKTIPPPVRRIKDKVAEKFAEASDAAFGSQHEPDTVESVTSVIVQKVSHGASKASEAAYGSTGSVEGASSKVSSAASSLSDKIIGSSTGSVESATKKAVSSAQSIASQISEAASSSASSASSAIYGESSLADTVKQVASSVSSAVAGESRFTDTVKDAASSATEAVKSNLPDKPMGSVVSEKKKQATQSASSAASSSSSSALAASASASSAAASSASSASSAASSASRKASATAKKVFGGAMAEVIVVPNEPILDDDIVDTSYEHSARVQQVIEAAGDKASQLTRAIQDALRRASSQATSQATSHATPTSGVVESATSLASEQYEHALSAASGALYGNRNYADKATDAASRQYWAAVTAASYAIYGTPITAAPMVAASAAYDSAIDEAAKQYGAIKSSIAEKLPGESNEQHVLASARSAYSSAVTAASYAIYGTPATVAPFQAASSAYMSAVSDAQKHYEIVKSRVSAQVTGAPKPVHEQMYSSAEAAYSDAVSAANQRLSGAFGAPITQQNYLARISSVASSRLADGVSAAQAQYHRAKVAVGAEPTPVHEQYLTSAQAAYYQALGLAHGRYSEFVDAASSVVAPTPTATGIQGSMESVLDSAKSAYSVYTLEASSKYSQLHSMASSAAKAQSTTVDKTTLEQINAQLSEALAAAQEKLSAASASAASAYSGSATTDKPLASRASENWEALISKASEKVYGAPPPFTDQAYSRAYEVAASATDAAAQATQAAAAQWDQVQALFSELVVGKEPDFTASVYSRLESAYATGAPALASQASSYVSGSYDYVTSAVVAAFVPPTQVPSILEQVQEQLDGAVNAASVQAYGTKKGAVQQATEAAASMYSDAASQVSEAIYGTDAPYYISAQASIVGIGASASSAISAALYGSSTPVAEAASSAGASVASSISSVAAQQAASASKAVSSAVYGEEQSYLESVQSQLGAAMASATSRLAAFGGDANKAAEQAAKTVSSVMSEATDRIRDEL